MRTVFISTRSRVALVATLVAVSPAAAQRPTTLAGRSVVYAPHGMIATSQPLASAA